MHLEDRPLISEGKIPLQNLYTIRKGERVHNNIRDRIEPTQTELIKVKSRSGHRDCRYYELEQEGCRIYGNRPLECRALKCWDTAEIESIYNQGRLERNHLLENLEGMWDLVLEHERRCDMERFHLLVRQFKERPGDVDAELKEMVRYDHHLRNLLVEKGGIAAGLLDFLFGRPLAELLHPFGIELKTPENSDNF